MNELGLFEVGLAGVIRRKWSEGKLRLAFFLRKRRGRR
jgi:hypothetical protein